MPRKSDSELQNLWEIAATTSHTDFLPLLALADRLDEIGGEKNNQVAHALRWMAWKKKRPRNWNRKCPDIYLQRWVWETETYYDTPSFPPQHVLPGYFSTGYFSTALTPLGYDYRTFKEAVVDVANALNKLIKDIGSIRGHIPVPKSKRKK